MFLILRRPAWHPTTYCAQSELKISPFSHKNSYFFFKRSTRDKFLDHIRRIHPQFFGSDAAKSSDLCRIVNDRNYQRITRLLDNTKGKASSEYDYFVRDLRDTLPVCGKLSTGQKYNSD